MAAENFHEERLVLASYDDRIKELFKVFAEGLAQGEPERPTQEKFRRALSNVLRFRTGLFLHEPRVAGIWSER